MISTSPTPMRWCASLFAGADAASMPRQRKVTDLPRRPLNHHWTKNVIASRDGGKLYVTVGSNSNVAENGMDKEQERAAIWKSTRNQASTRVFASGLRNPNGMAWEPDEQRLVDRL